MRRRGMVLALIGAALFVMAITLDPAMAWRAPVTGLRLLRDRHTLGLGLLVLLAVSANIVLCLPLPSRVFLAYVAVPWMPLLVALLRFHLTLAALMRGLPSLLPWSAGTSALLAARALAVSRGRAKLRDPSPSGQGA